MQNTATQCDEICQQNLSCDEETQTWNYLDSYKIFFDWHDESDRKQFIIDLLVKKLLKPTENLSAVEKTKKALAEVKQFCDLQGIFIPEELDFDPSTIIDNHWQTMRTKKFNWQGYIIGGNTLFQMYVHPPRELQYPGCITENYIEIMDKRCYWEAESVPHFMHFMFHRGCTFDEVPWDLLYSQPAVVDNIYGDYPQANPKEGWWKNHIVVINGEHMNIRKAWKKCTPDWDTPKEFYGKRSKHNKQKINE